MMNRSELERAIIMVYFSLTTVSTVGFGDFHPKSDYERIVCAFIMVGGVTVFSYFMGDFIQMLSDY